MSRTKAKHVSSAIIGHVPAVNSFFCFLIWRSSVPPEKEISFNYTNDDDEDDNSHGDSAPTGIEPFEVLVTFFVILLALLCLVCTRT